MWRALYTFCESALYWFLYWCFYRFSGAHQKPTSDSKHNPTLEHQRNFFFRSVRFLECGAATADIPAQSTPIPLLQVPELHGDSVSPRLFHYLTRGKRRPVVIRGLLGGSRAVKEWGLDFFEKHYGQTRLLTLRRGEHFVKQQAYTSFTQKMDVDYMTLAESLAAIREAIASGTESPLYINNVTEIFCAHPELLEDLDLDAIRKLDCGIDREHWLKVNMFLGGPGTGSSLHCAVGGNFFFNVCGRKQWTLIDPHYSKYLKTTPAQQYSFVISAYDLNSEEDFAYLERRIPMHRVVLEPGDCLYVPPWWLHHVWNVTDFTIGCAVRDHYSYTQSLLNNPMFMLQSPYWYKLHPTLLRLLELWKGRKFLLEKSMNSDRSVMLHLTGKLVQ